MVFNDSFVVKSSSNQWSKPVIKLARFGFESSKPSGLLNTFWAKFNFDISNCLVSKHSNWGVQISTWRAAVLFHEFGLFSTFQIMQLGLKTFKLHNQISRIVLTRKNMLSVMSASYITSAYLWPRSEHWVARKCRNCSFTHLFTTTRRLTTHSRDQTHVFAFTTCFCFTKKL